MIQQTFHDVPDLARVTPSSEGCGGVKEFFEDDSYDLTKSGAISLELRRMGGGGGGGE